jgi:arginase family enzyme
VYLSVDIDVLKIEEGTGYPDGDLDLNEVEKVIDRLNPRFADLVEVAPPLDESEETVSRGRFLLGKLATVLNSR